MKYQIEVCASSISSAINAQQGGADRIEFCDNLWEGGTTPSAGMIALAVNQLRIPVFVLVRPRGGDFTYSELEFESMKRDVEYCKQMGAHGIVSGVLLADGQIDVERTQELRDLSGDLPFTFHRAFDHVPDPFEGLAALKQIGVDRILTSGQQPNAHEGKELIKKLIAEAGDQMTILPGSGIGPHNVLQLVEIGCTEFHLSAKSPVPRVSSHPLKVALNGSSDIPEDHLEVSDPTKIKQIRKVLDEIS